MPLVLFVSRSKLILDFALTIHLLNILTTWVYSRSLPTNLFWWGMQSVSAAVMVFLGIWACRYRELRPISFGAKSGTMDGNKSTPSQNGSVEELGEGHVRGGRGRGRMKDEGPAYEMVAMKGGMGEV